MHIKFVCICLPMKDNYISERMGMWEYNCDYGTVEFNWKGNNIMYLNNSGRNRMISKWLDGVWVKVAINFI